MNWREETIEELQRKPDVSVLILGCGINGLGVFRELALQGVDCLAVDKSDFVAGASSTSSRMIHGGLRYLENREFRLVRESLVERNRLLANAPHYVAPLKTTIPLFSWFGGVIKSPLVFLGLPVRPGGRGALVVKFGLWFYDFVTRKERRTPRHFLTSKDASLRETPGLNPAIKATATYWDACISQAERLCIELIHDARAFSPACRALNYMGSEGIEKDAVLLKDHVTGALVRVRPKAVINATGAWVDITNGMLGLRTRFMGGTKGSHLVVENEGLARALGDRMVYYEHVDGRVCIVFRFMGTVIMGSTDIPVEDPDTARCDEDEIEYMLTTLRSVFPGHTVRRNQILYTFCGVRPLPLADSNVPGRISRDHRIEVAEPDEDRAFPVFSLIGGKWTTFRALAEQTADRILPQLGVARTVKTRGVAIGGGKDFPLEKDQWIERVARVAKLSHRRVAVLLDRYGTAAEAFAESVRETGETPLQSLPDYTVEEINHLARQEYVVHVTDLVCRRSVIALLGNARRAVLEELAAVVGARLGWDEARRDEEVELALREVSS